jgi:hypothetical protein
VAVFKNETVIQHPTAAVPVLVPAAAAKEEEEKSDW